MPGLRARHAGVQRSQWGQTFDAEYQRFADACDAVPDAAWDEPDRLPAPMRVIDPYGAETPGEFFAVASEAFFVEPAGLSRHWPVLYGLLKTFYRQDPASM